MKPALPSPAARAGRPHAKTPALPPSLRQALSLATSHASRQVLDDASVPPRAPTHLAHTVAPNPVRDAGSGPEAGNSPRVRRVTDRAVQVQIVEDLPRVQQLLRQLVEQPGRFEVTGIDDTEHEAFQRSQAQPPDALVVDLNLRQGSGLGLIHAVRKLYGASPTGPLIIVVTNHTMPVLEAACIKAGADHFLDKSRELPRLSALLGQAFFP